MENEILENGTVPETEEVVETVVTEETVEVQQPAEAPQTEEKKNFADTAKDLGNTVVAKGKDLWANRASILEKIKAIPKKMWIIAGGAVAALVAAIVLLTLLGNTYKTPIKLLEKVDNAKNITAYTNAEIAKLNGLCEKEYKELINILKKSDEYKDFLDETKDDLEDKKDEYGNNYKVKYKVEDKEAVDKEDLRESRDFIRETCKEMLEEINDMDSDDYEDLADELGLTKSQAKKLVKIAKKIAKELKNAKVTKGYKVTVTKTLTGRELDEPIEKETTIQVYKVNGRWVSTNALLQLLYLF